MQSVPILKFEEVTKTFAGESAVCALDRVSFEIMPGEMVAVMGPSGSGKSTLLNLACGLDSASSGKILLEGTDLTSLNDDDRTRLRRDKIGMIFQTFNLLPTLTALENVSLPLRFQGTRQKESEERARAMLEEVGLSERVSHLPDQMSGGERQRVAIARALVFNPTLLLADEPTGNLDSKSGEDILNILTNRHEAFDTTLILVTHDETAAGFCGRIIKMLDGAITDED